jgi:hypothetical protein
MSTRRTGKHSAAIAQAIAVNEDALELAKSAFAMAAVVRRGQV